VSVEFETCWRVVAAFGDESRLHEKKAAEFNAKLAIGPATRGFVFRIQVHPIKKLWVAQRFLH